MRCDVIAAGVISAVKNIGLKKPVILRMKGTNVKEAKKLVEESGLKLIISDDLDQAALKAVKVASIVKDAEEAGLQVQFA